ncbi:MAG: alpha/beta hydrolase [Anaerolineae bacterium]
MGSTWACTASEAIPEYRHRLWFYVPRALKWLAIGVVVLLAAGFAFQRISTAADEENYPPRGQLYTVNNRQMHILCAGEGSPAVILEAGGAADSLWWYWVQQQLAEHTRVCAYDRAGHGWSESASGSRDPQAIASDLQDLLAAAGVLPPYVMAGHSFGAVWARIYAAQHSSDVVGLVLVDSTVLAPEGFANQNEFLQWRSSNDALKAIERAAYEFGAIRATAAGDFERAGYPADRVPEMVALRSRVSVFEADYAEQVAAGWEMRVASAAAENLGNLPIIVLWASETNTLMETVPALREPHDEISTYSSNSVTRIVDGANHGSILGSEQYARQVSDALLDMIEAVETGEPLAP